ncbi:hypothetical protein KY092_11105 [Natronomonas gomsonensis]|jgi:hypothetical protein|uniref:hypothetical protein n=1 Tax=Natronomonas gomsonensis TaxID=1046043 RepID=UPI0020CA73DA|nr:hypothetical protein [Natronomonas gomsonensis]MCY4731103.1 hypothetical protein [Natronomonas gomsonensis]
MTGMKEGAGEDPFAEETTADDSDPVEADADGQATADEPSEQSSTETTESQQQSMTIPYKFRRDGVQDGRDRVPLFLLPETKRAERDALRELEERFDADVSLTDLREALVRAGLEHLDDVEGELEEWGYGMTFDEP